MEGFVYFFKHNEIDAIKIGLTIGESIKKRFTTFLTYSPFGAKVIGYIKTDDCISLEKEIHKKLINKRISNREWFLISQKESEKIILDYGGIVCRKKEYNINNEFYKISKKDKVIELYKNGARQSHISKELKTPASYVSKIINNYIKNISQNT